MSIRILSKNETTFITWIWHSAAGIPSCTYRKYFLTDEIRVRVKWPTRTCRMSNKKMIPRCGPYLWRQMSVESDKKLGNKSDDVGGYRLTDQHEERFDGVVEHVVRRLRVRDLVEDDRTAILRRQQKVMSAKFVMQKARLKFERFVHSLVLEALLDLLAHRVAEREVLGRVPPGIEVRLASGARDIHLATRHRQEQRQQFVGNTTRHMLRLRQRCAQRVNIFQRNPISATLHRFRHVKAQVVTHLTRFLLRRCCSRWCKDPLKQRKMDFIVFAFKRININTFVFMSMLLFVCRREIFLFGRRRGRVNRGKTRLQPIYRRTNK